MDNLKYITKKARLPLNMLIISLTLIGLLGIIYVIESIYFGKVLDSTLTTMENVKNTILIILLITFSEYILGIITTYTINRGSEIGLYNLRKSLITKISSLKFIVFDKESAGDILSRTMSDLNGIGAFFTDTFINMYKLYFTLFNGLIVCLFISIKLTLIGFVFIPIVSFLAYKNSKIIENSSYKSRTFLGNMNSLAHNILSGMVTLKSFTLESIMLKKFNTSCSEYVKAEKQVAKDSFKVNFIGTAISYGPQIAVIIAAGLMGINGTLSSGQYLTFTFTFGMVSGVLYKMQSFLISLRNCEAMAKRVLAIYDFEEETFSSNLDETSNYQPNETPPTFNYKIDETYNHQSNKTGPTFNYKIDDTCNYQSNNTTQAFSVKINNLSFSYDNNLVLKDINLNIEKNEKIAFVGSSGCGKSTLLKILSGLYLPKSGKVSLCGFDLIDSNIQSIRNKISCVSQETFLFPKTILENLSYANRNASKKDIINACKRADIHDFIMSLPQKYDTFVGEKGVYLSGGQRQRIAIACAFLKNSEILILDEPTSALDSETERNIQKSLDNLIKNKTAIIVAHRLSTIRNVDKIYVLHKGQIVECGTHEDLIKQKSFYYNLYKKQIKENSEEVQYA